MWEGLQLTKDIEEKGEKSDLATNTDKSGGYINSLNLNNLGQGSLQKAAETTIEVNLSTMNTQSLRNKEHVVLEDFKTNAVDLSVLTETWLDNTENDKARLLSSPLNTDGLKIYTKNRVGNKGGGKALVSRDKYKVNALALAELDGFEAQVWKVEVCRDIVLTIVGVYRPPYSVRNGNTVTTVLRWIHTMDDWHDNKSTPISYWWGTSIYM